MAANRKHMGTTTKKYRGVTTVKSRGREVGRVSMPVRQGHAAAVKHAGGYKFIGHFPTHQAAVSAVSRSMTHKNLPVNKTPKLKRPGNSIFKRRTHPTQSLGV